MESYLVIGATSTTLPVSLVDLKAHLNITGTQDDTRLTALEWSAVDFIERQTDKVLVAKTITEVFPAFPSWWNRQGIGYTQAYLPFFPPVLNTPSGLPYTWGRMQRIELSRSPIQTLTSVQYYDINNALQTLTLNTDYFFCNPTDKVPFLQPVNVWALPYFRPDAVQITYQAGYTTVPGVVSAAIKLLCGALNENREDFNASTNLIPSLPIGVQAMIDSISAWRYV